MAAATGIIRKSNQNLLSENVGPISITSNWAKSLLYRMNIGKRRDSSAAKITASNYEKLKEQFLLGIMAVIEMEEIPILLFSTGSNCNKYCAGINMDNGDKRGKKVEMVGTSDKRQITAVVCRTMDGKVLPFQLIYEGKTSACLPKCNFPEGWHITCTSNHWSNEQKMKEYLDLNIFPYV